MQARNQLMRVPMVETNLEPRSDGFKPLYRLLIALSTSCPTAAFAALIRPLSGSYAAI